MKIYPLRFQPVYKDYIWGGDKILRFFHREEKPGTYAESWEVSDREDGMSIVSNGEYQGKSLHQLMKKFGCDLCGEPLSRFPLLIKIIDAHEKLSVQVHPDDASAKKLGSEAKTEMWYVLDADDKASTYAGFKKEVDEAAFRKALKEKTVMDLVHQIPVVQGDVIYIPGGTVHAIGEGCLLLEVQQNSNTTYRVYDYDRAGKDGKMRPLHIEEAVQVLHWDMDEKKLFKKPKLIEQTPEMERYEIIQCPYFHLERLHLQSTISSSTNHKSFHIFFAVKGKGIISSEGKKEVLKPGVTYLIPAAAKDWRIDPDPSMVVLKISLSSRQ